MKKLAALLNEVVALRLADGYAIGGATASIYYCEPFQTQDIDVFVALQVEERGPVALTPIYDFLK